MILSKRAKNTAALVLKALCTLLYISPFYIVLVYAVKSKKELALDRLAFPTSIHWQNFTDGIEQSHFFRALGNSLVTTVVCVLVLTLVCSMSAYILARRHSRFYTAMYYLMLAATLVPFQAIMTPLYKNLKWMGLIDTLSGFSLVKISFEVAFTTLVITGFVKNIPYELEEAAMIDGTGAYGTFFRIVLPLMKPILCTSAVLNVLSVWNDFQISVVLLQAEEVRTLSLTQYYFFGKNSVALGMAFAVFLLSMIPVLTVYFTLQKYIVSGITAGAGKG
ncbi:carbohydrate ABC transporter permease [uncultured Ruthenibacterium sp.]|uniref:carbohydrate ABC transporter permease n=1 Tax=uncultured Ruthenibacterium sp. TaxID=1905347 RepID=UPI00349EFFFC